MEKNLTKKIDALIGKSEASTKLQNKVGLFLASDNSISKTTLYYIEFYMRKSISVILNY